MKELTEALEAAVVVSANNLKDFLTGTNDDAARAERARISVNAVSVFTTALAVLRNEAAKPSI